MASTHQKLWIFISSIVWTSNLISATYFLTVICFLVPFFLTFFVLTSVYLFISGVEVIVSIVHSHWHTHIHSMGLLWTTDQSDAEKKNLTTHNTQNTQTSMPLAGFEPAIPASERPQTHALDRAATWIGDSAFVKIIYILRFGLIWGEKLSALPP